MKKIFLLLISIFLFLSQVQPAYATVQFELIPPSGQLTRGQDIQFAITVDVQGETISNQQIGITYQTQYLQYLSITPGDTMTTVTASDLGEGKILITGTHPSGYTGQGVFAYANFRIIADAPGETELCTLWAPSGGVTPTPIPTQPAVAQPTCIPMPTDGQQYPVPPYCAPAPQYLPQTGNNDQSPLIPTAAILLTGATSLFLFNNYLRKKSQHT
jgi:LPXTG-motif cell wall-anchored protein